MKRGRMKVRLIVLWGMFLLSFVLNGCKSNGTLNSKGIPDKIIVGEFGGENPANTREVLEPVCKAMEQELGIPVQLYLSTDYAAIIEAIHAKKIHIAYLGGFSYILAAQHKDIDPIAILGQNGKEFAYHSNIFVKSNSGLNSMADVKARAKDLTFCFTDPASTSGHLVPRGYLVSIGLDPLTSFKQTLFAGSHAASILTVAAGKVDVGCATDDYGIDMQVKKGLIKKGELKVLWVSDPIVGSPIVVRKDINPAFTEKIKQFYFNLSKKHPEIFDNYLRFLYVNAPRGLCYIPAQDSMFNGVRKLAANIRDLKTN
ncbi:MAG TPA: phosphate/phosphite/phosphonate ABC transporter substrate-binding protein [Mucilaginibacter sp.]